MKIEFKNEEEKELLILILTDWIYETDNDFLACAPMCRDETSPGCYHCYKEYITEQIEKGESFLEPYMKDLLLHKNKE